MQNHLRAGSSSSSLRYPSLRYQGFIGHPGLYLEPATMRTVKTVGRQVSHALPPALLAQTALSAMATTATHPPLRRSKLFHPYSRVPDGSHTVITSRRSLFTWISYLAIAGNVLGGLALLLTRAMPASARAQARKLALWGIAGTLSLGDLSDIGVGVKQKDPTVLLANLMSLCMIPFFARESHRARGLFLLMMGTNLAGYAKIIGSRYARNRQEEQTYTKPITDIPATLSVFAKDHLKLLETITHLPQVLGKLGSDLTRAANIFRNGGKLEITPSADRIRLSAFSHYLGGLLLLLASKKTPWLAPLGSAIAAIGGLGGNLEWFAVGTQRNDLIGTILKVGMPIQAAGKAMFHTNAGYALEIIGQGMSYALASDLTQTGQDDHSRQGAALPTPGAKKPLRGFETFALRPA